MKRFCAGVVQVDSQEDRQMNMQLIQEGIYTAVQQGAEFVILPETAEYIGPDMAGNATTIPGYLTRFYSSLARKFGIYLHCGSMTVRAQNGRTYNKSLLFGPEGNILAEYDKLHMFDVDGEVAYRESSEITQGSNIVLAETPLATFGFSICYDIRFPELYRVMTLAGASVMLVAANFTKATGRAHWEPLLRARAIENGCYVIAACQCGDKYAFEANGHSMIISPRGEILVETGEGMEVITAVLDPNEVINARNEIPSLMNRRDDLYDLSADRVSYYE